jgi:hypothetical protein
MISTDCSSRSTDLWVSTLSRMRRETTARLSFEIRKREMCMWSTLIANSPNSSTPITFGRRSRPRPAVVAAQMFFGGGRTTLREIALALLVRVSPGDVDNEMLVRISAANEAIMRLGSKVSLNLCVNSRTALIRTCNTSKDVD